MGAGHGMVAAWNAPKTGAAAVAKTPSEGAPGPTEPTLRRKPAMPSPPRPSSPCPRPEGWLAFGGSECVLALLRKAGLRLAAWCAYNRDMKRMDNKRKECAAVDALGCWPGQFWGQFSECAWI